VLVSHKTDSVSAAAGEVDLGLRPVVCSSLLQQLALSGLPAGSRQDCLVGARKALGRIDYVVMRKKRSQIARKSRDARIPNDYIRQGDDRWASETKCYQTGCRGSGSAVQSAAASYSVV
jgi:hypothetical protein